MAEYRYKIKIGADMKTVSINANSTKEAENKVKEYAKKLKLNGKQIKDMGDK